jgi:hypothetical protein
MATSKFFNGKLRKLPGVYSRIISGIKNPPQTASYGNILMIDTGSGATFGGGAGIAGTLSQNADSIYGIDNIRDFREFVGGGLWWLLAKPLFQPNGVGTIGVSKAYVVRAAATVPAEIKYYFGADYSGSLSAGSNGGTVIIQCRKEGVIGNGLLESGGNLYKGYAGKMIAGVIDTNKFIVQFYEGTWRGLDTDGDNYDGITQVNATPTLICQTPEFANISEFISYTQTDATFNSYFKLKSSATEGTGAISANDLINYSDYELASGGTETFSAAHLATALEAVKDLDYSFVLCDDWGDEAKGTYNGTILTHITTEAKFEKFVVIGGGKNKDKFHNTTHGSIEIAEYYDSDRVIVVHGGVKIQSQITGVGYKEYDSIYKAAAVLGRLCGLEPQIPGTFKGIDIYGELHPLTEREKEQCLDAGVLCTGWDSDLNRYAIVQAINTLQENTYLINEDATSHSIQVKRIVSQLNKELTINAKKQLFGGEGSANRFTMSSEHVKTWVESYLKTKVCVTGQDNLIIKFQNVTVTLTGDYYDVTYEFAPNSEITKLFITGVMLG